MSSGAVASGRSEMKLSSHHLDTTSQRQLFSAVGQVKLINRYYELFRDHGMVVGQVLTMKENFSTRRHYLNQKNLKCFHLFKKYQITQIKLLKK